MERRPLVVGNWKMHGSVAFACKLAQAVADGARDISGVEVAICPPSVLLGTVAAELSGSEVRLGAQTVSEFEPGAYTGETAAEMLVELGCRFVIVGHSERRHLFGESSEVVAAKTSAVMTAGLTPIVCVGETLEERRRGATNSVIAAQLSPIIDSAGAHGALANMVFAYEPVWAIGTGETATPEQAREVHGFIRSSIAERDSAAADKVRILYGGSVKPDNATDLFQMAEVDGGLIGGASLKAEDFLSICGSFRQP